jgi:Ca2+-binding EF-hand superfamily protein
MSRIAASIFASLGTLLATPALPQGVPTPSAATSAIQYLGSRLSAGMTLANYLQSLRNDFAQLDADGDGAITAADIALHDAVAQAAMVALEAQQTLVMDLNGDGVVTEDEVRQVLLYRQRMQAAFRAANPRPAVGLPLPSQDGGLSGDERIEQEVRKLMAADTSKKGRITWEDAIASVKARAGYAQSVNRGGPGERTHQLLAVAGDGRDSITLPEVLAKGEAFFRSIDTDGKGVISLDALQARQRSLSAQSAQIAREEERRRAEETRVRKDAEAQAACALPKPSDAAKVILLGAYGTEALSDTTIGSQDIAVGAGGIVVEPGDDPLYVVVSLFRPTIWRMSGAVARIERLALTATAEASSTQTSFVGATGIAADRVSFPPYNCIDSFWEDPSTQSATAAASVRRDVGRQPAIYAKYGVGDFVIPSGQIRTANKNDRPALIIEQGAGGGLKIEGSNPNVIVRTGPVDPASELSRYFPGGVLVIDPATLVASRVPEKYQVLPYQAGLIQLLQSGALKRVGNGEYLIQEKIRLPAGLYGGYSVKFLLLRGVPKPDGDPGHSTVISEETGRPVELR